jgi:pimeloyl-ACP methyl ester carboxylesterase
LPAVSLTTNAFIDPDYAAWPAQRKTRTIPKVTRIRLNGHPTWALLPAKKVKTVVLLHGGLSSSASLLRTLGPSFSRRFAVAAFDRRGHGKTADTDRDFSYNDMADETIAFLEFLGRRVFLLGHSDGANVALLVALRRADLVKRVVLVGANYHFEGLMPMPDFTPESDGFSDFARHYAKASPNGIEHAAVVVRKSQHLVTTGPTLTVSDLATISVPVLVMSGDDDVTRLEHTVSLYESIPESQLAVFPGTSHSVLKERTKECARTIERFFLSPLPPVTEYPLRRRE